MRFDHVELAKRPSLEEFTRFAALLEFVRMDLTRPDDYARLRVTLAQRQADTVLMYMATAPSLISTVCEQLAAAGLNTPNTRVVLEKPLGHDLASNRAINETVSRVFAEKQVFRIDHYLGKPAVQNLFALRFGNALFEPLWRREHIANIQITIAEELGVEKRGAFYETTGALRDMVQNHALQLLCAIGMEPPINSHADAIRDEKLKVLRSLKPWSPETLTQDVIRGQYAAGTIAGTPAVAYREETGVSPHSPTETFVALRTEISNWRWAGVPFYIRTGKRLAGRDARIVVNFRPTPHAIFNSQIGDANRLVINLQPRRPRARCGAARAGPRSVSHSRRHQLGQHALCVADRGPAHRPVPGRAARQSDRLRLHDRHLPDPRAAVTGTESSTPHCRKRTGAKETP